MQSHLPTEPNPPLRERLNAVLRHFVGRAVSDRMLLEVRDAVVRELYSQVAEGLRSEFREDLVSFCSPLFHTLAPANRYTENLFMPSTIVTCLGHGGAFSPLSIGNTSFLIDHGPLRILVDCGTTVPESLAEIGVDPASLTHCVVTHLHADHAGGLERLLYHRHYIGRAAPLPLIMGHRVAESWTQIQSILKNDLLRHARVLGDITGVVPIGEDESSHFSTSSLPVAHGGDIPDMPGYAFTVCTGGSSVFFSGDRVWRHDGASAVMLAMQHAHLAFHEIELGDRPSGAHTHHLDVQGVDLKANVRWVHHGLGSEGLNKLGPYAAMAMKGDQWQLDGADVMELGNIFHPSR